MVRKIALLILILITFSEAKANTQQPNSSSDATIYTKAFAKRFNLRTDNTQKLPTGIYAIAVTYNDEYTYHYGNDSFSQRYNLINLSDEQKAFVNKHLEVFPILFADEKMPLTITQSCDINIYLEDADPLLEALQLPEKNSDFGDLQGAQEVAEEAYGLIAEQQTGQRRAETLNLIKHETGNYYGLAYLTNGKTSIPLPYKSYRIHFLPEVSFITLGPIACENIHPKSILWLKTGTHPNDAYKMPLPRNLSALVQANKPKSLYK